MPNKSEQSQMKSPEIPDIGILELKANLNPEQRAYLEVLKDKMKKVLGNKTKQELAKAGDLPSLKNYKAVLEDILEFLKTKKMNMFSGVKSKEFWDWMVDKKELQRADPALVNLRHGEIKTEWVSPSKSGEDFVEMFNTNTSWLVYRNGKEIFKGDNIFNLGVISDDGEHFAAVINKAVSGEVEYEIETDQGIWGMKFSEHIDKVFFSPDGKKLAVIRPDETFMPIDPYFDVFENENLLFQDLYDNEFKGKDIRLKDFVYCPDSQKSAAIFHEFDKDMHVEASIVIDGDQMWQPQFATLKWLVYSPDGKKLAVVDGEGQIMVNQKYIDLAEARKALKPPVFSPNGEKIAYVCKSLSTANSESLAENDRIIWGPARAIHDVTYSDDGKNIAAAVVPLNKSLALMVLAINGQTLELDEYSEINHLTWSPDNKKIMFVGRQGNQYFRVVKDVSQFLK